MNTSDNLNIEETRLMGLAGLSYLGETAEEPVEVFSDGKGNLLEIYSDGSLWLCANISEFWPSVGDYLSDCVGHDDPIASQVRAWAES